MTPFRAPLEDMHFSLAQVADAGRLPDWDGDLASEVLTHFADFAETIIAPLDATGDAQGCRLNEGRVSMPDGFTEAYADYVAQGWHLAGIGESAGGMGLSAPLASNVSEIFAGACHSLQMITALVPGAVRTLERFGSEAQKAHCLPRLCSGDMLATMCLTEPGAGSDLAAIRTRAIAQGDHWRINGEKIFISGADQDLTDEIVHLILARSGDSGVQGLSLFLAYTGGEQGRNGMQVLRLEEKLGLHASPTCHVSYEGTRAELLGQEGQGLMALFTMMNHARLDVARQGVAHAARASHIARDYARSRRQGRRADGRPALLSEHADVQRMLDEQRCLHLAARAMCDIVSVEQALGERPVLVDFLTPICKVFASEAGIRSADIGIQVLGGYGYLQEYRIAQTWRDARITAIYEGANGIHERAMAGRNLTVQHGAGVDAFCQLVTELAGSDDSLQRQLAHWQQCCRERLEGDQSDPGAHAFAGLTQSLLYRAVWHRMNAVTEAHPEAAELQRLYLASDTVLRAR